MKIAFYAPMKAPDHPVPSGDRQMARLLMAALERAGHKVTLASHLRSYGREPDEAHYAEVERAAHAEIERLSQQWASEGRPDIWFCYHPYYKSPDVIGPALADRFGCAYITAEASYSARRNIGVWEHTQASVIDSVKRAAVNFCFTTRDREGLATTAPDARLALLPPFIDTTPWLATSPLHEPGRLITVAMMRSGDKFESYRDLAAALTRISHLPWQLAIIGGGPEHGAVEALFSKLPPERIEWLGELAPDEIARQLARASIYVWPGHGEAFGLAYLEAQAVGLPVVAQAVAGVPEVVENGETGLLTPAGDVEAFAEGIASLLTSQGRRDSLAATARRRVEERHSLTGAARRLDALLPRHHKGMPS